MNFCKFHPTWYRPFLCEEGDPEEQKKCIFYAQRENGKWCLHCYNSAGQLSIECFSEGARNAAQALVLGEKK